MDLNDPGCVIIMMNTYGMLEKLEGSDMQMRYEISGGGVLTKRFNYLKVFVGHFSFHHQVDDNNNRRRYPISVDRTLSTKY